MPGHIEDDAIVGAQLAAASQDVERKTSTDIAHKQAVVSAEDAAKAQAALPIAEKDIETLGQGLEDFPTEEELNTLRRVAAHIPPKLFTIAFIEMAERFSYYGCVIVVCVKRANPPFPPGVKPPDSESCR